MLLKYFLMLFFFFFLSFLSKDCMCYDRHGDAFVVARTSTSNSSHRFAWKMKAAMTRKTLLPFSTTALASSSSNQMEEDTEELMTSQRSIIQQQQQQQQQLHIIGGITFREIPMDIPKVGTVTILEATSEAQEDLVNMVLLDDDDDDDDNNNENGSSSLISAGDPYGAVLWPAAWAVANYLIGGGSASEDDSTYTNKSSSSLDGKSILELGAGTGLVSIAMALAGAKKVVATDFEPLPLTLTKYAAKEFHNLTTTTIDTQLLDLCDKSTPLPYADIVVAADIMYEPKTGRAMAHRVLEALQQNSRVVVGDSPGRAGRPTFLQTLNDELGLPKAKFKDTIGRTISSPRHDLICGKGSSSVSETPKELTVAIMDLRPSILLTS